ncbi:MAG TPA: flagellar hook-associated protein FlgK [Azospirillaceae bacterium]|nr:flagellar hook-associated protein FlgK [Azospirillaceae bacterium]
MSLIGALNSATAGLKLIQSNIEVVSGNVSRSDDPNRTRHSLERTTDGSGTVTIAQFTRRMDVQLRSQLEGSLSEETGSKTLADFMRRVGDLLGTTAGKPGLSETVAQFNEAWRDLEATPESSVAQGQVVLRGDALAREMRRVSAGIEDISAAIGREMDQTVDQLNDYLKQVDAFNDNIAAIRGARQPTAELEDQRDALVRKIAEITSVRVVEREAGKIALFTPSGLSLVDASPNKLLLQNGNIVSANSGESVVGHIRTGKLGALLEIGADGSKESPPRAANLTPTAEIVRKLRSQMEQLTQAFIGPTRPGEPTSFADAYDQAMPVEQGELRNSFFVGDGAKDITINPALLTGEVRLKQSAIAATAKSLIENGRTLAADGVVVTDVSYAGMVSNIMSSWTSGEADIKARAKAAGEFKDQMESRFHSAVGVNLDEEIADLQVLQRNYSATARVMQTVSAMFDALERIL